MSITWLSMVNSQVPVQKPAAARQVATVHMNMSPVKLSTAEIKTVTAAQPVFSEPIERKSYVTQPSSLPPIQVSSPVRNDIWDAGNEYEIKWSGAQYDVRIKMASLDAENNKTSESLIIGQAPNTGTYRFRVPYSWVILPLGKVYVETIDNKQIGHSMGRMNVYTQPVDMECQIVDAHVIRQTKWYVLYIEGKKFIEFNVLMRNKGTTSPITLNKVLVRFIKEPEDIVVYQEDWGFSGIYYHDWYRLPEPRRINISSYEMIYSNDHINFDSGSYRVEVEIDPQNQLGENQILRADNRDMVHFNIQSEFKK